MTPDELRREASELLRLARIIEASPKSERVREADRAILRSRELIAKARRQLGHAPHAS